MSHYPEGRHPALTRRVRLVMWWNGFVFKRELPDWLGWDLTVRKPGCVMRKVRRR